ncbi:MAG TPA: hypothetical protein DEH78_13035, partial [Solibacterales bacterium]|nr:hypothetical protein [Bryobacterales bacterium]
MLVVACGVLAILQYRWTGELSRAESERLRRGAGAQLSQLARAFDSELRRAVIDLVPKPERVASDGWERANVEQVSAALKRMERPMFRRVFAAVPSGPAGSGALNLYQASPDGSRFSSAAWPETSEWQFLRKRLSALLEGAPPFGDIVDPLSNLIEAPVFGEGGEQEWVIAELDVDYVASVWLPELVRTYLNGTKDGSFRFDVRWREAPARVVFSTAGAPAGGRADGEATIFPTRFLHGGPGGRGEDGGHPGRWMLEARHTGGTIEAAVASSRRRNLGVALALLLLIAGTGATLIRNT